MKIYGRVLIHFYNDIARSFINFIDEYGVKESESLTTLDIEPIIRMYSAGDVVLKKLWYHKINLNYDNDIDAVQSIIEMEMTDGHVVNVFHVPIDKLIQIYEYNVLCMLCAQYNIKSIKKDDIYKMFDETIDKEMKGEVSLFASGKTSKGVQELTSTIEELILTAKASSGTLQELIDKHLNNEESKEDAEYVKRSYNAILTLSKQDDDYNLNVDLYNLKLKFDIALNKMSEYEMISIYDLIRNNDKIEKKNLF